MSAVRRDADGISAPLLNTVEAAARRLSVSKSKFYLLVAAGELRTLKLGSRTMVTEVELERFVERLQSAGASGAGSG